MINGVVYDHESIKVMLPTGMVMSLEDVSYSVKKDVDVQTDKTGTPRGVVHKAFEGDFKATMSLAEFELLNKSMAATGILGAPPIPVVITYGAVGQAPIVDTITVKITEVPRKSSKDSEVMMEITGKQVTIPILNGQPAYIPIP